MGGRGGGGGGGGGGASTRSKAIGPGTPTGTRVQVTRNTFYDGTISAGQTGTITSVSPVSRATANGGGYDIHITLDNGRKVVLHSTMLAKASKP